MELSTIPEAIRVGQAWALEIDGKPAALDGQALYWKQQPDTLKTFEEAQLARPQNAGLSRILRKDDRLVCVDLDGCVSADGKISPPVERLLMETRTYAYVSRSGRGIHVWFRGMWMKGIESHSVAWPDVDPLDKAKLEVFHYDKLVFVEPQPLEFRTIRFHEQAMRPVPAWLPQWVAMTAHHLKRGPAKSEPEPEPEPEVSRETVEKVEFLPDESQSEADFSLLCELVRQGVAKDEAIAGAKAARLAAGDPQDKVHKREDYWQRSWQRAVEEIGEMAGSTAPELRQATPAAAAAPEPRPGPAPEPVDEFSADELLAFEPTPQRWVLPGLLARGQIGILAGAPKMGKSWWALIQACQARCSVMYYGLEDSKRRLAERLQAVRDLLELEVNPKLRFRLGISAMAQGGSGELQDNLADLVIIDTMGLFAEAWSGKGTQYAHDLKIYDHLRQVARAHQIAILGVSHLRKSRKEDADQIERISGSVGTAATFDSLLVLTGARHSNLRTLEVTGKDVDPHKRFYTAEDDGVLREGGQPEPIKHQDIYALLYDHPDGLPWAELGKLAGYDLSKESRGQNGRSAFRRGVEWLARNRFAEFSSDGETVYPDTAVNGLRAQ